MALCRSNRIAALGENHRKHELRLGRSNKMLCLNEVASLNIAIPTLKQHFEQVLRNLYSVHTGSRLMSGPIFVLRLFSGWICK